MKNGRDILFILMLCTTAVYFNHFNNSFHFDDAHTIVNNLSIRNLGNIPHFFSDGSTFSSLPTNQSYRPVITTLNAIDYSLSANKNNTFWFHLSIFASFLATGILLFLFLQHFLNKLSANAINTPIALFITGWFWLHPANAETINYIIARSDSFSTCMVLLSFVMYARWETGRKSFLYLLPYAVGFLSKETAIIFLPLLFLFEFLFNEKATRNIFSIQHLVKVTKKLITPIILSAALLIFYMQMLPSSWESGAGLNKTGYWLTQPYAILHYIGNFFIPVNLVADSDWTLVNSTSEPRFIIGGLVFLVLISMIILTAIRPRLRLISFGLSWFLLALMPTSMIPLAEVINDHRTFFPYVGLFIASAGLFQVLILHYNIFHSQLVRNSLQFLSLFFFVALAFGTWNRNKVWHSENTLWKEVTIKAPANGRGWMNYGITQMQAADYKGAERCFMKADSLTPGYAYLYINLGILKNLTGQVSESEGYFKSALAYGNQNPDAYAWYSDFLINHNRLKEAGMILEKGLIISPNHEMLNRLHVKIREQGSPLIKHEIIN